MTKKKLKVVDKNSIWADKDYVDWWSIVHFSSGVLFAIIALFLEMSFLQAIFVIFILATIYEIIEPTLSRMLNYEFCETKMNQIIDVLAALAGTAIGFKLGSYYSIMGLYALCLIVLGFAGFFKKDLKRVFKNAGNFRP